MATIKMVGTVVCRGDFGNPSGTGLSNYQVPFVAADEEAAFTALALFHTTIKTAQLTACNQADLLAQWTSPIFPAAPGVSVNTDRVLLATWRKKDETSIHRLTIPGVPETSTGISDEKEGERLNATGKAALAGAIEAIMGYDAGDVVVLQGKVFIKK